MAITEEQFEKRNFKVGYGNFPYLIMRVSHAVYMQIPVHFIKEGNEGNVDVQPGSHVKNVAAEIIEQEKKEQIRLLHDEMIELTQRIFEKVKTERGITPRMCLVEGQHSAYYFEDGEIKFNKSIPSGGTLIDQSHSILAMNIPHFIDSKINQEL
jgi:hypothetical protein